MRIFELQFGRWGFRWHGSAIHSFATQRDAQDALARALSRGYP
jgi:hypothetical protein